MRLTMTINGMQHNAEVTGHLALVDFLRDKLGLTGTHVGCDTGQCGACVVHIEGKPIKSCTVLAATCEGLKVTTVEGIADGGTLHPMQTAFRDCHALQCGFCTPGMVMMAISLAKEAGGELQGAEIRSGLEGNFCRCTGYANIIKAIKAGSRAMQSEQI